jgi:hypothetical protein
MEGGTSLLIDTGWSLEKSESSSTEILVPKPCASITGQSLNRKPHDRQTLESQLLFSRTTRS